jgi:hypothetical protein
MLSNEKTEAQRDGALSPRHNSLKRTQIFFFLFFEAGFQCV